MPIRPVPGLLFEQQSELVIVRMCLADEARGVRDALGDLDGLPMLGIWHVIRNRALKNDTTMKAEILKPLQFSGFNEPDGHRAQMVEYWKTDVIGWNRADAICDCAERGATIDLTAGSLNFYAPLLAHPAWGRGSPTWNEKITIDGLVFGVAG